MQHDVRNWRVFFTKQKGQEADWLPALFRRDAAILFQTNSTMIAPSVVAMNPAP